MKLAEGLLLRADLIKKIEHLQNRIRPVLIVSDNKLPQEDPVELLQNCARHPRFGRYRCSNKQNK